MAYDGFMSALVLILVIVLSFVALTHGLWGIGYWFPLRDEKDLVKAVVGVKGATRMPGAIPCGLVAASLIVTIFALLSDPSVISNGILALAAVVFLVRGLLSWVPVWRRAAPQEPFATYDRRLYGPVSFMIGVAIGAVLYLQ